MTEPRPVYATDQSEAEIQREVVKRLRAAGWVVKVFSTPTRKYKQEKGWIDFIAFRHGHTLAVEMKTPDGDLEPSQVEFRADVTPHLGPHLVYRVVRYVEDVGEWT